MSSEIDYVMPTPRRYFLALAYARYGPAGAPNTALTRFLHCQEEFVPFWLDHLAPTVLQTKYGAQKKRKRGEPELNWNAQVWVQVSFKNSAG